MDVMDVIPENPDIEASGIERDHVELPPNLAENRVLVSRLHDLAHQYFTKYQQSSKREKLIEVIREASAMYTVSKRRDRTIKGEDQQSDTLANIPSTSFYKSIRVITAGQTAMMFNGESLPARYAPVPGSEDYTEGEGRRIADTMNSTMKYTWGKGDFQSKLKKFIHYVNRYGVRYLESCWSYRTEKRIERVPGYYTKSGEPVEYDVEDPPKPGSTYKQNGDPLLLPDGSIFGPDGAPLSYAFVEKERIVRDCFDIRDHDPRMVYLDLDIEDIQDQPCVITRSQVPVGDLYAGQRDGFYVNTEKLSSKVLWQGRDHHGDEWGRDLDDNYDLDGVDDRTGNADVFHVRIRVPIDSGKNRRNGKSAKTRGDWDKSMIPEWYEAVFVGQLGGYNKDLGEGDKPDCECIQLRKLPYNHGRLNMQQVYSHVDDNGGLRTCYASLLAPLYEAETFVNNEHMDNVRLRSKKPWIGERGNVLSRDLKFRGSNQLFWVKPGTSGSALTQLQVDDTTGTTLPYLEYIDRNFNETAGTDKPLAGEYAGARTTGTEFLGVQEAAMKPALEDAERMADQIFPWMFRDAMDCWRQFGDPSKSVPVEADGDTIYVNPTETYGELSVVVQSIGQYESDMTTRQTMVNLVNSASFERVLAAMGPEGEKQFWPAFLESQKVVNAKSYFPPKRIKEIERIAWGDVQLIMNRPDLAVLPENLPEPDDSHADHLRIKESAFERFKLNDKEYQDPAVLQAFQAHITFHRQLMEQEAAQAAAQAQSQAPGAQPTPGATEGQLAGQALGGLASQAF